MKVFISWSGARSKAVAEALDEWLGDVIQKVEPWISPSTEKGTLWSQEIGVRLAAVKAGIVCVTPENQHNPWLNFEAGAISKASDARVYTFLFDMRPADVVGPLSQFQHTTFNRADMTATEREVRRLVSDVNGQLDEPLRADRLGRSFEKHWSYLPKRVGAVPLHAPGEAPERRDADSMVAETLERIREVELLLRAPQAARRFTGRRKDMTASSGFDDDASRMVPLSPDTIAAFMNSAGSDTEREG